MLFVVTNVKLTEGMYFVFQRQHNFLLLLWRLIDTLFFIFDFTELLIRKLDLHFIRFLYLTGCGTSPLQTGILFLEVSHTSLLTVI